MTEVEDILAEVASRPPELWQRALRTKLSDEVQVRHALIWLHANREAVADLRRPDLGSDRYQLDAVLDRGATATVWQAYDRKLGRNVAIKVFCPDHAQLAAVLAEARAACEVVSDHVVRVHDVVDDEESPFIVMELIGEHDPEHGTLFPGRSAAQCVPASFDEAVRWIRDVARGVHDAHLRNVFHRDLKPANVLITPFSRRAKIADFGLAIGASTPQQVTSGMLVETPHGPARIVGTPAYMAPEQARGLPVSLDPRNADERTTLVRVDVWGLGAIACALVTGRAPWRGTDDLWELAASGLPPSVPDRMANGRWIPPRLRRVILRALAVDPRDRYATAAELADELDAYLARRPTSLDRGFVNRAGLWARRNPQLTVTLAVAAILCAMLTATITSVLQLREERALLESDRAHLSTDIASARAELDATEQTLHDRSAALADLRRAAADAQADYQAILASKEKALVSADRETKALADELAQIRADRDTAETARDMYEGFWKRTRAEAAVVATELETAEAERDKLRAERDRALKERDSARAARQRAEAERDAAEAERARTNAIRRRLELEAAQRSVTPQ